MTESVLSLHLCRVYRCLPSALDEQDPEVIAQHLTILAAEQYVQQLQRKHKK